MGFYKFFRVCFFILVLSLSIWCCISISPDKCNCSSSMDHNILWTMTGIFCSLPIFALIYNFPGGAVDQKLFFKLFSIPKNKYKYTIDEHINVKDNTSKYFPLVKTTYFYPPFYIRLTPFYIHLITNNEYNLIDPKNNFFINNDGYESRLKAMQAITYVKLDINKHSFKYQYDRWFCHICWMKDDCLKKVANEKPLDVKIKKTFNK